MKQPTPDDVTDILQNTDKILKFTDTMEGPSIFPTFIAAVQLCFSQGYTLEEFQRILNILEQVYHQKLKADGKQTFQPFLEESGNSP